MHRRTRFIVKCKHIFNECHRYRTICSNKRIEFNRILSTEHFIAYFCYHFGIPPFNQAMLRCQFSKGYNFISITLNKFSKLFIGVKYKREVVNYYLHFRGNKFETMRLWKKGLLIFFLKMIPYNYKID